MTLALVLNQWDISSWTGPPPIMDSPVICDLQMVPAIASGAASLVSEDRRYDDVF